MYKSNLVLLNFLSQNLFQSKLFCLNKAKCLILNEIYQQNENISISHEIIFLLTTVFCCLMTTTLRPVHGCIIITSKKRKKDLGRN